MTESHTDIPSLALNDGRSLPAIGLGTYPLDDDQAASAVGSALSIGYRLIDTAAAYGNEAGVGRAISELRGATRRHRRDHQAPAAGRTTGSRRRLSPSSAPGLAWAWSTSISTSFTGPCRRIDRYVQTWRGMIRLRTQGLIRSIGVSNFTAAQIERLEVETGVLPAVNQIELHPHFPQTRMLGYDRTKGIVTQSWSPLGRGELLDDETITAIAAAHQVSPAQVVLRWHVQRGAIPIPKSATPARQATNLEVFGFELTDAEMAAIARLDHRRLGGDPDTHEEF